MTRIIIAALTVALLGIGFWASSRISDAEEEAAALQAAAETEAAAPAVVAAEEWPSCPTGITRSVLF